MAKVLKGGCLCGGVRFEIAAEPAMTGFCHCLSCQKLSGAGHAFHVMAPKDAFTVGGPIKGYAWKADSGNTVTTYFCTECGSPVYGESSGFAGAITVRAAALDDPGAVKPQMTVYAKRVQPWDHVEPSVPSFPAMPPMPASAP